MSDISNNLYLSIGHKIKEMRKSRGLGQEELANMISLSRSSISNIESGKHQPSVFVIYEIALALDCELNNLLPSIKTYRANNSSIGGKYFELINSKYNGMSTKSLNFLKEILHDDE
ncbi:helix-turn-helix domain-containing protein [Polaribacter glomeratus]|nr:helix-turn-helix transcriptional regulator [Polaribacter glomeratus]